ncbi:MAG: hypothetical protein SGILL_002691 [Bacillariaceae sp.]
MTGNPLLERQVYQDVVLSRVLDTGDESITSSESANQRPFLVYTAGPMGVGKSYVLSRLHKRGIFPLEKFVKIDPDMLKSELPEMAGYLQHDSESAATKLHKESTQMSDVLFEHSLADNRNILVDGSLRDTDWYDVLFHRIRTDFPQYRLVILYVSATSETIKSRARRRAEKTGRAVPEDLLQESIDQVPKSVAALAPLTDHTFEVSNDDGAPMIVKECAPDREENGAHSSVMTEETTWETFRKVWQPKESSLHEEQDGSLPQQLICTMMEALACPIQSKEHISHAKEIWGKAYPSFCPRCTLNSDKQCKKHSSCGEIRFCHRLN